MRVLFRAAFIFTLFLASPVLALERAVTGDGQRTQVQNVTSEALMSAVTTKLGEVLEEVDRHAECNNLKKLYAPDAPDADANGCVEVLPNCAEGDFLKQTESGFSCLSIPACTGSQQSLVWDGTNFICNGNLVSVCGGWTTNPNYCTAHTRIHTNTSLSGCHDLCEARNAACCLYNTGSRDCHVGSLPAFRVGGCSGCRAAQCTVNQ